MKGINKVILVCTLGRDPEVRYMPDGGAVANVSAATNEEWKDKQTGEKQSRTEWHNLVFWKRLAEIAGEYLRKGSTIYVEGKLKTDKYTKDGIDRYTTKIHVTEMQMLGGKAVANTDSGSSEPPQAKLDHAAGHVSSEPTLDFDDIPF